MRRVDRAPYSQVESEALVRVAHVAAEYAQRSVHGAHPALGSSPSVRKGRRLLCRIAPTWHVDRIVSTVAARACTRSDECSIVVIHPTWVKKPLYWFTRRLPMKSFVTLNAQIPLCCKSSAWLLSVPGDLHPFFCGHITTL